MRWIWIDAGNDAAWHTLAEHGIAGEFYCGEDPVADVARRLEASRAHGHVGGIYVAWNWANIPQDGGGFAEWTHEYVQEVEALLPVKSGSYPKVQLNHEGHDPDVILDMLHRWRQLRPTKDTSWSPEGMQGGWMSGLFAAEVKNLKIRVVPQCYNGAMTQVWDSLAVARDLTKRGFPDALVSPFYDAAHLPEYWSGWAFTQGRLP